MKDNFGRTYAKLSELKPGDRVQVDGDFTCIPSGAIRIVREDKNPGAANPLYIACRDGGHLLDGQLSGKDDLIGVYPI